MPAFCFLALIHWCMPALRKGLCQSCTYGLSLKVAAETEGSGVVVVVIAALSDVHMHSATICWAEIPIEIARMTLTVKLDGNWSSLQLANNAPPLSFTDSAVARSARIVLQLFVCFFSLCNQDPMGFS